MELSAKMICSISGVLIGLILPSAVSNFTSIDFSNFLNSPDQFIFGFLTFYIVETISGIIGGILGFLVGLIIDFSGNSGV